MRILLAAALATASFGFQGTAWAQDGSLAPRVDRLEREMRAVQRKVFPNGAGQMVEPQITPQTDTTIPGTPATSVVTDLTLRVSALEGQIQTITAQTEQNQFRMRQLQQAFDAYRQATEVRLKALEAQASAEAAAASGDSSSGSSNAAPDLAADKPAAKPSADRAAKIAAVQRPDSGDPAEDGYVYGFRLWQAKLYPEARKALQEVATKYPKHRRASYARNLIGRAYLDENAPSLAAVAFYDNYKKDPNGERAADSLYYLAQALVKLKKPAAEVCKVYDELTQVYPDQLSAEMRAGVAQGRADSKCK